MFGKCLAVVSGGAGEGWQGVGKGMAGAFGGEVGFYNYLIINNYIFQPKYFIHIIYS